MEAGGLDYLFPMMLLAYIGVLPPPDISNEIEHPVLPFDGPCPEDRTWVPPDPTAQRPIAQGDDMQPREVLNAEQSISSANGRFRFIYQGDGNLVLYDGSTPLWASHTEGRPVGICIMQEDGNLVIYEPGGE